MSHVAGFDLPVDWVSMFMIAVVALIVLNMHLGISYTTMLLPLREWTPGLGGLDTMVGLSIIIYYAQKYWGQVGWISTFVFVFAFIWLIS
jgi:hypothetical protein